MFKEARKNKQCTGDYFVHKSRIIWQSKKVSWNWIAIEWGIRLSKMLQWFPIWNMSHNNCRSLQLGVWKLYIRLSYHRKNGFNQKRNLPFRKKLWKFYQLIS